MNRIVALIAILVSVFVMKSGAFLDNTASLSGKEGVMCKASEVNWGECNSADDYWTSTSYEVNYDGTITVVKNYNLSGRYEETVEMSDDDLKTLYKNLSKMKYKDTSADGCDGTCWKISFEGEDKFYGYIEAGREKTVAGILGSYEPKVNANGEKVNYEDI